MTVYILLWYVTDLVYDVEDGNEQAYPSSQKQVNNKNHGVENHSIKARGQAEVGREIGNGVLIIAVRQHNDHRRKWQDKGFEQRRTKG